MSVAPGLAARKRAGPSPPIVMANMTCVPFLRARRASMDSAFTFHATDTDVFELPCSREANPGPIKLLQAVFTSLGIKCEAIV